MKGTVQVSLCNTDSDCSKGNMCSFNEETLKHQCIPANQKILYQGCLNTKKFNEFNKIESSSPADHESIQKCIDFTRRQKNSDGLHYNYMIFKNKINAFVDLTTINVYLKCNGELLLVMPTREFFEMKCDDQQKNCILKPNETFRTFVESNAKTCGGNLSLEIEYSCENENIQKTLTVPIREDQLKSIKIDLTCPIQVDNSKFQSKCIATYFDTRNSNPGTAKYLELLDKTIEPENCVQPVYKVPLHVTDVNVYRQLLEQKTDKNIQEYNQMLNNKEEEMIQLKIKQLKMKFKKETQRELNDEEARKMVEANKVEYFETSESKTSNGNCTWKIHEHKNPFGAHVEENDIRKYATPVEGKYYLIEEARNKACELNASMFIWFSNSYDLSNLRNQLFILTPSQVNTVQKDFKAKDWAKWAKVNNVHVGVLTTQDEMVKEKFDNTVAELNYQMQDYYKQFLTFFEKTTIHTEEKVNENNQILQNLDSQLTTITEDIKKNEFESDINQQMTIFLSILALILVIILIGYYIYQNYLQK